MYDGQVLPPLPWPLGYRPPVADTIPFIDPFECCCPLARVVSGENCCTGTAVQEEEEEEAGRKRSRQVNSKCVTSFTTAIAYDNEHSNYYLPTRPFDTSQHDGMS